MISEHKRYKVDPEELDPVELVSQKARALAKETAAKWVLGTFAGLAVVLMLVSDDQELTE